MTRRHFAMQMPSLALLAAAACGSGLPPRSAALDPSNPNGPESPPLGISPVADSAGAAAGELTHGDVNRVEGSEHHVEPKDQAAIPAPAASPHHAASAPAQGQGGSPKAIVYTCPMHPEVTSSEPGKCPKCGMKLMPKKDAQ
jgi:heavy metal-binding protein